VSSNGITNYEMGDIDITSDGEVVIIGTQGGLFRSADNGENFIREGVGEIYPLHEFESENQTDTISFSISAVYVHPANNDIMFAGNGWNHQTETPQATDIPHNPCKIYRSIDGAETWETVAGYNDNNGFQTTNNSVGGFGASKSDEAIVYMASYQGVYKSLDTGKTWSLRLGSKFHL